MPYACNEDLPPSVRNHLPLHAQDIYRAAYNNAWLRHADRGPAGQEQIARRIAWAAVERRYQKLGDDWAAIDPSSATAWRGGPIMRTAIFQNRSDAGRRLALALARYRGESPIILALPRGGVLVATEIASALSAQLDLVLLRKNGPPYLPELAMGEAASGLRPIIVRNSDVIARTGMCETAFAIGRTHDWVALQRRRFQYLRNCRHPDLAGKTAILVDDGVAAGATLRAALRAVRIQRPKKLVLAIPVAKTTTLAELQIEADEVVCLEARRAFEAVGCFYLDFDQVSDAEVVAMLASRMPSVRQATAAAKPSSVPAGNQRGQQ